MKILGLKKDDFYTGEVDFNEFLAWWKAKKNPKNVAVAGSDLYCK